MLLSSNGGEVPQIAMTILSGALGYILLEYTMKEDKYAALAAAFLSHLCITCSSLPKAKVFLWSGKIPLAWNVVIVLLSYLYSLFKSYAMRFLPMSVFLTASNLQLLVAMLLGKIVFSTQYTLGQFAGVVLVVLGCTMTAIPSAETELDVESFTMADAFTGDFALGSASLVLMLLCIAGLMPTVNYVVRKYHADTEEQLFMQHSLALPLFALQWTKLFPILTSFHLELGEIAFFGHSVPTFFLLLIASTLFTHINRTSSATITRSLGSLTSQLVAVLTKTVSSLLSFFLLDCNFSGSSRGLILFGIFLQTTGSVVYAVNSSFEKEKSA